MSGAYLNGLIAIVTDKLKPDAHFRNHYYITLGDIIKRKKKEEPSRKTLNALVITNCKGISTINKLLG